MTKTIPGKNRKNQQLREVSKMVNGLDGCNSSWNECDSQRFIDYGNIFIPERDRQTEIICNAIPEATESDIIVELCCGEGLLTKSILQRFPKHSVYAFDGSPTMITSTKNLVKTYEDRIVIQQFDLTRDDWRTFPRRLHAVVSSLSIHHLGDQEKCKLFNDLAGQLAAGGALILADVVKPASALGTSIAAKEWDEVAHQNSLKYTGNLDAYHYFCQDNWNMYAATTEPDEYDKPSTLFDQLRWLKEAGLEGVDVFFMRAGHAVFGGYKPC